MKKEIIAVIILLVLSFVHGNVDIEDREYALVLGVDAKEDDQWKTTWSFADLSKVSETKGKGAESASMSITGANLQSIEKEYNYFEDKVLEYGHLKALILGKHILDNPERYEALLKELREDNRYSRNMLVFYTEREASSIVKLDEKTNGLLADILKRLEERHIPSKTVTLKTVLSGYWEGKTVQVPILGVKKEKPAFIGYQELPVRQKP